MGRRKLLFISALCFIVFMLLKCLFHTQIDPSHEEFLNLDTCPACYGLELCPKFIHGDIVLIGGSKLKYFQFLNAKNVYYGKLNGERVVLKKLAHDWEIRKGERTLRELTNLKESVHISTAVRKIVSSIPVHSRVYFLTILKKFNSTTDIAQCPSERLLSYIYSKMRFSEAEDNLIRKDDIAQMMYSLFMNPEAVILQAFSQNEGWPFPQYKGSCGRVIVEEYVGRPLYHYENSPWIQRLDLSYQLLQIAELLTDNSEGFALYLTDVNMDNFAVKPDGTILLVDVENIIIVDRLKVREGNKGSNLLHQSKGDACQDGLSFSIEDLCQHELSDHNYYAICRGLFVPNSYYSSKGLLHSIPTDAEQRTNLTALLNECAAPKSALGRFVVVPKLLQAMKSLL